MKFTITINKNYKSLLSKEEIVQFIESLGKEKKFGGLRIERYKSEISSTEFVLQRRSYGLDGFTLETFPLVKGVFLSGNPTIVNIQLKPSYLALGFFCLVALIFLLSAIFANHITMNGVYRTPTISDRLFVFGIGVVMPLALCYFSTIRPVTKAEKWIVEKLQLTEL